MVTGWNDTSISTGWVRVSCFALLLFVVGSAQSANAQRVILSGDVNIVVGLDPNQAMLFNPENQQFFINVLGDGTEVAVLENDADGEIGGTFGFIDSFLLNFYGGLPSVTATKIVGGVNATVLAGMDLFLCAVPDDPFTAGEIGALENFRIGGGSIFFFGDGTFTATQNGYINEALAALDVDLILDLNGIDSASDRGFPPPDATGSRIIDHPLTTDVDSLTYALTSTVTGGTPLFLALEIKGAPFVAFDSAGVEEFFDLPAQIDDVGVFDPGSQQTVFTAIDFVGEPVANVSGALASFVGAGSDAETDFLRLGSDAGVPDEEGVRLVTELPDFLFGETNLEPDSLLISARRVSPAAARGDAVTGVEDSCIRPRLTDADGAEAEFIDCASIEGDFADASFPVRTRNLRTRGSGDPIDLTRVVDVTLAVETTESPMSTLEAAEFQIASVVRLPEPSAGVMGVVVLVAISVLGRLRRQ